MVDKAKVSTAVVVKSIEARAKTPLKKLQAIKKVKTNKDNLIVADNLKLLKELKGEGMRQMNDILSPMNDAISKVKALFQPFFAKVNEAEAVGKEIMYGYVEAREKAKIKLDQDYASGKIKSGMTLENKKAALAIETGESTIRKVWTAVEIDADKTPRKFMIPDEAAIRKALKEGKTVPGWEWRQVNNIAI